MKKTILYFIKITVILLFVLQVGKVEAQTSCTVNGVTITATGTSSVLYSSPSIILCDAGNNFFTGSGAWTSASSSGILQYSFSKPVVSATIAYTAINYTTIGRDIADLSTNTGGVLTLSNPCNVTVAGTTITAVLDNSISTGFGSLGDAKITVSSTVPFTSITTKNTGGQTGWVQGSLCNFTVVPCAAGSTAPILSGTTINNSSCATPSLNLNSLITSTVPSGASIVWYTNNTHTGAAVLDPTAVTISGTYYAFYYDATNNCFGPATAAVTATVTVCPLNIATSCPVTSVNLASRVTGAAPNGYSYTYHSGTPATASNKLTSSVVTTSGTYYVGTYLAAQSCYTATSRPIVVTIPNCCAAQITPDFTN